MVLKRQRNLNSFQSLRTGPYFSLWGTLLVLCLGSPVFGHGESVQLFPSPASGHSETIEGIKPSDVLARIHLFQADLELIRYEMGKPKEIRATRFATKAQWHEVYFQALTLFIKADRLALELTGSTGIRPPGVSLLKVKPFHVWQMINAAYARIAFVKEELTITQTSKEHPQESLTDPTEIGRAIIQANRQINLMLERRFAPSDVFQQVGLAIGYADSLLAQFPSHQKTRQGLPFEKGKQPSDVFLRLVECYERIEVIAHHSGIKVLDLDSTAASEAVATMQVIPSDVYDLATLIVSDLAYLHSNLNSSSLPNSIPYPGRKFPSHVYQKGGVLLKRLVAIEKQVQAHPGWLQSKK